MHSEVLSVYDGGDGHVIEALHEKVVSINIVSCDHFLSESEVLSHVSALVITSQQYHILRVIQL